MAQGTQAFKLDALLRNKIEKLRKKAKDVRIHNRLSALLWLADGQTPEQIAGLLGICHRTVTNWLQLYLKGGLAPSARWSTKAIPVDLPRLNATSSNRKSPPDASSAIQVCDWVETNFRPPDIGLKSPQFLRGLCWLCDENRERFVLDNCSLGESNML